MAFGALRYAVATLRLDSVTRPCLLLALALSQVGSFGGEG
jgi:hypothetical protein